MLKILKVLKIIIPIIFLSSCAINQDYYFEKDGEVRMDVGIDMGQLMKSLPNTGDTDKMDFSKFEDSLQTNGALDSLKQYGVSEVNFSFDTNTYTINFDMLFDDLKSFTKYMNHDRADSLKPIEVYFSKKQFGVKNCTSLISQEMMDAFSENGESGAEGMDMNDFFKFKTTYHFPYEIDSFKSKSGKGMLSEDKKSIMLDNVLDEFKDSKFNGDLEVKFK